MECFQGRGREAGGEAPACSGPVGGGEVDGGSGVLRPGGSPALPLASQVPLAESCLPRPSSPHLYGGFCA